MRWERLIPDILTFLLSLGFTLFTLYNVEPFQTRIVLFLFYYVTCFYILLRFKFAVESRQFIESVRGGDYP